MSVLDQVNSPADVKKLSNEALEEYLETYPIEYLMHNWQEDFISPYDEIINQRLTHIALQNLNNAKAVQ